MANYNVVETTKISGRCYDFQYTSEIENGSIIAKGDLMTGERNIYAAEIPQTTSEVFLVANPAWSYDDCRAENQNECNYINAANKPFRGYQLNKYDKFGVESYGISNNTSLAVGDYVVADGTTVKLKDVGTSMPDLSAVGFVGKVVEIENYGFNYTTGTAGTVGVIGKKTIIEVVQNVDIISAD